MAQCLRRFINGTTYRRTNGKAQKASMKLWKALVVAWDKEKKLK
jgi:hypothetical protein